MLEAKQSPLLKNLFSVYNKNLLRRNFNSLRIKGLDAFRESEPGKSKLILANHSSWWDGLITFQISRRIEAKSFWMMEERHLKKYPLFRRLGAFSIVRERAREAVRSLHYARSLLQKPDSAVWMFPQGEIFPNGKRPVYFYRGFEKLLDPSVTRAFLVSMTYEYLGKPKADVIINIEAVGDMKAKVSPAVLAAKMEYLLDQSKKDIEAQTLEGYVDLNHYT